MYRPYRAVWYGILNSAAEDELGPDGKRIRPGINPVIIAELAECNALLSGQRKKRQVPFLSILTCPRDPEQSTLASSCLRRRCCLPLPLPRPLSSTDVSDGLAFVCSFLLSLLAVPSTVKDRNVTSSAIDVHFGSFLRPGRRCPQLPSLLSIASVVVVRSFHRYCSYCPLPRLSSVASSATIAVVYSFLRHRCLLPIVNHQ
ncbi:hypothetical protein GW17_00007790 [Ensete ventricosum]|nr:hypothetical protein GW17_00007790 [Ensete ventricosum]